MNPTQTTQPPSRHRGPIGRKLIGGLLAATIAGGCLAGVGSAAAGASPTWSNIKVSNAVSSTNISFDANTYSDVYVIVGTGADPKATQVARVIIPKRADHHYSATISNLQPSTHYSFRLATPIMAAYTDTTSILTLPSSCTTHCISQVNTVVNGPATGTMDFSTALPAMTVTRILVNGQTAFIKSDGASTTSHHVDFFGLEAGTAYTYEVKATDNEGTHVVTGAFTTKAVRVTVKFNKIHVTNDSDSFGAGEMFVSFRAGATLKPFLWSDKSVSTGDDLSPNLTLVTTGALTSVPASVEMLDEDCGFCTYGIGQTWDNGSTSQIDWATATTNIVVPADYHVVPTTAFTASVDSYVGFTVSGTFSIDYV